MYYFLKKSDFNLENYDFDIELSPRLTKKEQKFLKELLSGYDPDSQYSTIEVKRLGLSPEEVEGHLEALTKKTFSCWVKHLGAHVSRFYFGIFTIAALEEGKLIYEFSQPVKQSMTTGNIFARIGISSHLQFSLSYTKAIYNLLLKENKHKGVIELTLDELKDLLHMDHDRYPRFYDLETKVLKPIARDIEISENYIWFEKIKDCDSKGGRITGIRIHYSNLYHINIHRDTNTLIREYAQDIDDFTLAYDRLYQYIKKNGFPAARDHLEKNSKNFFS